MVAGRMYVHRRYPFDARHESFQQLLLSQIIQSDITLGLLHWNEHKKELGKWNTYRNEEVGLRRME